MMFAKLKAYLAQQFSHFDRRTIWSKQHAWDGLLLLLGWFVPAFLVVVLTETYADLVPRKYLHAAINEAIGPHLWNVMGTLGLLLSATVVLAPRYLWIARWAEAVLINTFAIGALSLGAISGKFANVVWRTGAWNFNTVFIGTATFVLLLEAIMINFSLWSLGGFFSGKGTQRFIEDIAMVHLRIRFCIWLSVSSMALSLFFVLYE